MVASYTVSVVCSLLCCVLYAVCCVLCPPCSVLRAVLCCVLTARCSAYVTDRRCLTFHLILTAKYFHTSSNVKCDHRPPCSEKSPATCIQCEKHRSKVICEYYQMDVFTFLWIYFTISVCFSLLIFVLYSLLIRYGKHIRRSDASKAIVAAALLAASITFLWYSISITLTIFNKWLMTRWHGGFKFPLLTSSVHMVSQIFGIFILL